MQKNKTKWKQRQKQLRRGIMGRPKISETETIVWYGIKMPASLKRNCMKYGPKIVRRVLTEYFEIQCLNQK